MNHNIKKGKSDAKVDRHETVNKLLHPTYHSLFECKNPNVVKMRDALVGDVSGLDINQKRIKEHDNIRSKKQVIEFIDKILGVQVPSSNNRNNRNNNDDDDNDLEEEQQQQQPQSASAPTSAPTSTPLEVRRYKLDHAVFWTHPSFVITYFFLWKELVKRKIIADKNKK
jgi:hypothetical protein